MSDEGIPAELREWVAEKRAILQAIDDPEQYEALRKQYEELVRRREEWLKKQAVLPVVRVQ